VAAMMTQMIFFSLIYPFPITYFGLTKQNQLP
jgi:hypothetical protein